MAYGKGEVVLGEHVVAREWLLGREGKKLQEVRDEENVLIGCWLIHLLHRWNIMFFNRANNGVCLRWGSPY